MLSLLRIRNLAIIEEMELQLGSGLNVITGETGSGKSVLLRSLELLCGKRASTDLVRHGAESCEIEALFSLLPQERERLLARIEGVDGSEFEDEIILRRVVEATGKSRFFVNSRLATAAFAQKVAAELIDFTGQHAQQALLEVSSHRDFIDRFGSGKALLDEVREAYENYSRAKHALETFLNQSSAQNDYLRRISFEVEELAELALAPGERAQLETELKRLSSVDSLREVVGEALKFLESEEGNICDQLRHLSATLAHGVATDDALQEVSAYIGAAEIQVGEATLALNRYASRLELDPEMLERVRDRISHIAKLERKYGQVGENLRDYYLKIRAEMERFSSGELDESALRKRVEEQLAVLETVATQLHLARTKSGQKLEPVVEAELAKVNMPKARFEVSLERGEHSAKGFDRVEFRLAANPGSQSLPLSKVASGGELSRILLVLKSILSEQTGASFQVFDEIDTGIGGKVAHVVGEKLKQIAKHSQTVVVTHAPQIASLADHHFVISKVAVGDVTRASIKELSSEERVREIARMLAGKKVSIEFENSARELLGPSFSKNPSRTRTSKEVQ